MAGTLRVGDGALNVPADLVEVAYRKNDEGFGVLDASDLCVDLVGGIKITVRIDAVLERAAT